MREPPSPIGPTLEEQTVAENAMWDWYLEWAQIPRATLHDRRLLRQLGFLERRGSPEVSEPLDEVSGSFARPPRADQVEEWESAFERELGDQPLSTHRSFTWDTEGLRDPATPEAVHAFQRHGYEYDVSVVLAATQVMEPRHPNDAVEYRPLASPRDWEQMLELQVECRDEELAEGPYREFMRGRLSAWRRLIDSGAGVWLGAFDDGLLVADAGLFWQANVARFQNVETRSSHRRQGICGSLVYRLSRYGLGLAGVRQLVMQADEGDHAARIYESVGFVRKERMGGLCVYDRATWGA